MFRKLMQQLTLDRVLIFLGGFTVVLSVITWFVIFHGGGTYILSSPLPTSSVTSTGSAATSTLADASSTDTGSSSSTSTALQEYSSTYGTPPITWTEGYDTLSITGATLSGSQLTLTVNVAMGAVAECVPMNIRLVANEQGDLTAPLNPSFSFGTNGTCIGTPGASYSGQQVVFNVDPTSLPLSFTTGGTSNEYFLLSPTDAGGITITLPATRG